MAGTQEIASESASVALSSYDTALCWIPDEENWPCLDRLRSLYDKGYEKWPPHVNLLYPFVATDALERASRDILSGLTSWRDDGAATPTVHLNSTGVFPHRNDNTVFLSDNDTDRKRAVSRLRTAILKSLSQKPSNNFQMHMTIGQSQDLNSDSHHFLVQKAGLLPTQPWQMDKLHILVREKSPATATTKSLNRMTTWGIIDLKAMSVDVLPKPLPFYNHVKLTSKTGEDASELQAETDASSQLPYCFDTLQQRWVRYNASNNVSIEAVAIPTSISIASYNVLAEFFYPVSYQRYPILVRNILEKGAKSDILVLQEVTDDFLTYLLGNSSIREHYSFASHGPPQQDDLEPLPSHLNVVILSRFRFTWKRVSFQRRHKTSIVAQFPDLAEQAPVSRDGGSGKTPSSPLVLATVHLTCGLTDGSVTAKKLELQAVLRYLEESHPNNPWILTGDFNISTSAHAIDMARQKGAISPQTVTYLHDLESRLFDAGLVDSWATAKIQRGDGRLLSGLTGDHQTSYEEDDDAFEGEDGATFDPLTNDLAAEIVGSGFNRRPQRYDRILVKGQDTFHVAGFNMFGQDLGVLGPRHPTKADPEESLGAKSYGSDHWGVRCSLKISTSAAGSGPSSESNNSTLATAIQVKEAPESLRDVTELKQCLDRHQVMPSAQEAELRERALRLLKEIVLQADSNTTTAAATTTATSSTRGQPSFVMVPVGSYGLGVWTASSDVDCLCIGPVSSHVFFSLAVQRIRKAEQQQRYQVEKDGAMVSSVRLVRKVHAHSGTMLELEVLGIKMDLQYCASAFIAETWPYATRVAPNDPTFQLSSQALAKLKPMRDLYYLRRTIPDFAAFRTAYHLVKLWAKQRGIYSAKFGYLGGIHISIMLSSVCKMICHNFKGHTASMSAATILTTFFNYYADFDWASHAVYDPFFHTESGGGRALRYVRTAREPLAILGWHGPALNVAVAASAPTAKTIAGEFRRAAAQLSTPGMTWSGFMDGASGPNDVVGEAVGAAGVPRGGIKASGSDEFLASFKSYVKIEAQFWGVSLAKGTGFVGWLESRCTMLLVDIDRRVPGVHARIWPARFVDRETTSTAATRDADGHIQDYKGYYLAGLEPSQKNTAEPAQTMMTKDESKVVLGALQTALAKFESQIRGDERFYDAKSSWMSASVVSRQDLGDLELDDREWGQYTIGDDDDDEEDDDDDDEEEEDDDEDVDDDLEALTTAADKAKSSKKKRGTGKAAAAATSKLPTRPAYQGKFRSSADVINRLRWDPDLDSSEYIVGYEDRFLGVRERALDAWKSEQTDEEFIPQHRILYFKRRGAGGSDASIVWHRGQRKDDIFGSGVSSLGR
ncbi:uncharacterized protein B0I36DRAFT_318308 [Microdochium trichocladiopsis]|uniref:polynucleotide adenylyltransferase n=1 Tax=Microdochium trichocladiopsis TaxID=1682393 RepID=A0A9P9BQZ5_9PEZI|nr:uncharacterized protein B0I36DRAFT_318308 [Microdochium trichocladiopsis]KAH7035413.1 hypothetical protein B0I36DRAFT_318308 [Microdochium trichocladiopsis]